MLQEKPRDGVYNQMKKHTIINAEFISGFLLRKKRWYHITILLGLIVLLLSLSMLMLGNTIYSPVTVLLALSGKNIQGASFAIGVLRLPRTLIGILAGFAFGIAGNTFQTMLRNPLASPDVIGVTSGTSLAAVFCMLSLGMSNGIVSILSVLAGVFVALFIYLLSRGGSFSGGRLILIGIGVQSMISAAISYFLLQASQYDVPGAMRWLSGSLNGVILEDVLPLGVVVVLGSTGILLLSRGLQILELGEITAITLGVPVHIIRITLIVLSVLLLAFSTTVTGPIAFVAFLSGPISNRLVGKGISATLPSGLMGSILVLSSDLIGQFTFDTRFPVGVITGILGAPYLLYLLIKMNKKGGVA